MASPPESRLRYPPRWSEVDNYLHVVEAGDLGFHVSSGDLNRFASRYRLAASLRSIDLDDYSQPVLRGYFALFGVFLAWSAFELFLRAVGCKQKEANGLLAPYDPQAVVGEVVSFDPEQRFFGFIHRKARKDHREYVRACFTRESCNWTYLASAIRHIFVHGDLTPSACGADPLAVCSICSVLRDSLFRVMDGEFTRRADAFLAQFR